MPSPSLFLFPFTGFKHGLSCACASNLPAPPNLSLLAAAPHLPDSHRATSYLSCFLSFSLLLLSVSSSDSQFSQVQLFLPMIFILDNKAAGKGRQRISVRSTGGKKARNTTLCAVAAALLFVVLAWYNQAALEVAGLFFGG